MKTLVSILKGTKHALWVVVAVLFGVGILLLRSFFLKGRKEGTGRLPEVPAKLKAKVEKVEEEALIARVEARVEAEQAKKHLDEVAAIDDGAERRARLAETLRNLK